MAHFAKLDSNNELSYTEWNDDGKINRIKYAKSASKMHIYNIHGESTL